MIYVCMYVCVYVCMYVRMYVYKFAYMHICIYVYLCIYICVCVCVVCVLGCHSKNNFQNCICPPLIYVTCIKKENLVKFQCILIIFTGSSTLIKFLNIWHLTSTSHHKIH